MVCSYSQGDEPVPGFRLVSLLGQGAASQVWKAVAPGGAEVAFKVVALTDGCGLKELRALRLYRRIRHPHLVPLLAFWLKDEEGRFLSEELLAEPSLATRAPAELLIAMGLGDKSLADRLDECLAEGQCGVPREELLPLLGDVARALDYLNQPIHALEDGPRALQHCDLKPTNILLVGGAAQVCDLGILRVVGDLRRTAPVGTAAYVAPEIIRDGKPSVATDQYALAISYHELRTGLLPFHASSPEGAYFAHLQGRLDFGRLPAAEGAVLARATAARPEARYPSCGTLLDALRRAGDEPATLVCSTPAAAERPAEEAGPFGSASSGDMALALPDSETPVPEDGLSSPCRPGILREHRQRSQGRSRRRLTGVCVILAGVGIGVCGSWLTRGSPVAVAVAPVPPTTVRQTGVPDGADPGTKGALPVSPAAEPQPPGGPFVLQSAARSFRDLPEAVAAAAAGDTVTIHGDGPFVTEPLEVWGKDLTIKAAPGFRPRLQLNPLARHSLWRSLLASDRALRLEGLELRREGNPGEPAYLVSCEQASLHLRDCHLLVPHGAAAILCRNPETVELHDCVVVAHAVALAVEVGAATECTIRLTGCSLQIEDGAGAALSLFAQAGTRPATAVGLHLERNTVRAGRVAAFKALRGRLRIEASSNDLDFREAVLSYVDFPGSKGWRQLTSWHGRENRYHGPAAWIQVDGTPVGVGGLPGWRAFWRSPETGSSNPETGTRIAPPPNDSDIDALATR